MRGAVHHIDLTVVDLARSTPFYDKVLGFLGYRKTREDDVGSNWELLFILIQPLVAESAVGAVFLALGTLGILLLALWALRARPRTLLIVGILALLTIHGVAADRLGEHWLRPATLLITAAFMGAVTAALLYYVLDWHPITTDKVFGAVAAYVLIAFTCLFGLLQQIQPHAFHASTVHAPSEH